MRILTILFLFFSNANVFSQETIHLRIVKEETKEPIAGVSIGYSHSTVGTFTNEDGLASIFKKEGEDLLMTHVNYDTLRVNLSHLSLTDTLKLSLIQKTIIIPEIAFSYFDLKQAIQYVLAHYPDLYVNSPTEKIGNFKETVFINGEIRRLIQSKLSWWSESYSLAQKKSPLFKLIDVEYNKNTPLNIFTDLPEINLNESKSVYVELKSVIPMLYLDAYLSKFLKYNPNVSGRVESSTEHMRIVSFQSDWSTVNNQTTRTSGTFTFDKDTKAIVEFNNAVEFKEVKIHEIGSEKKQFEQSKIGMTTTLSFERNNEGKFSLIKFELMSLNKIRYNNQDYTNNYVNTFYKLYEFPNKQPTKKGAIDLNIPLYRNLPQKVNTPRTTSINLTQKEANFMRYGK